MRFLRIFFSTHFFFQKCNFEIFLVFLRWFRERWPPPKHENTFQRSKTQFFLQKPMISTIFQIFGQKRIFLFENQPFKIGNSRLPRHWNILSRYEKSTHGANTVQTRCETRFKIGANTVQTRCKHGAKHGANTVQTRCQTRCKHGAN